MSPLHPLHLASAAIFALLLWGYADRRSPRRHAAIMGTAFAGDLLLVAWIEVRRAAVEKALGLGGRSLPGPLLSFHIVVSVAVLLLYVHQACLGIGLLRGADAGRAAHRAGGLSLLGFRFLNLATSLVVV